VKLSRAGLIFCGIYVAFAGLLLVLSYFSRDPKATFLFAQFSTIPLGILVSIFHLDSVVIEKPWLNNVYVFFVLNLAFLYLAGSALGRLFRLDSTEKP
jgi:hypothetical protein